MISSTTTPDCPLSSKVMTEKNINKESKYLKNFIVYSFSRVYKNAISQFIK